MKLATENHGVQANTETAKRYTGKSTSNLNPADGFLNLTLTNKTTGTQRKIAGVPLHGNKKIDAAILNKAQEHIESQGELEIGTEASSYVFEIKGTVRFNNNEAEDTIEL